LRDLKERFEVYAHVNDDFVWVGSTDSMPAARGLIRARALASGEQFTIYSETTQETTILRAAECLSPSQSELSTGLSAAPKTAV